MSKSDANPKATISILDDENTILKKFKSAVTDSEAKVCFREDKPGVSNLMTIYSAITGKTMDEITAEFDGKGYGDFKTVVGQSVADELNTSFFTPLACIASINTSVESMLFS